MIRLEESFKSHLFFSGAVLQKSLHRIDFTAHSYLLPFLSSPLFFLALLFM